MVKNMTDGQTGWIVPWHMWRDIDGKFWLLANTNPSDHLERTSVLRVCKVGSLYSVDIAHCKEIWDRTTLKDQDAVSVPVHEIKICGIPLWNVDTS